MSPVASNPQVHHMCDSQPFRRWLCVPGSKDPFYLGLVGLVIDPSIRKRERDPIEGIMTEAHSADACLRARAPFASRAQKTAEQ